MTTYKQKALRHTTRLFIAGLLACLVMSCGSVPLKKPQPPTVTIAGIQPISLGFSSQTVELTLRVQNPNAFALPMQALDFKANFSGEEFATGQSIEEVLIPAKGEALLKVEVKTGLRKLAAQLKSMFDTESYELNYGVTGTVKLSNWPKPIPINVEGELTDMLTN